MNWMAIAEKEIGVKEIPGSNDNPRIVEYHSATTLKATDDETPWCSAFVNWCMSMAGITGTKSAAARSWLDWGTPLDEPIRGAIVILKRGAPPSGHVGFVELDMGDTIRVLGGNQSDCVKYSTYKKATVLGYRWPKEV